MTVNLYEYGFSNEIMSFICRVKVESLVTIGQGDYNSFYRRQHKWHIILIETKLAMQ